MLWRSAVRCPRCGGPSRVQSTRRDTRYRVCESPSCQLHWRTQEVLQLQADELQAWYTDQTEESGNGLAGLMKRVGELYWHALNLGRYLGLDDQEVHRVEYERLDEQPTGAGG